MKAMLDLNKFTMNERDALALFRAIRWSNGVFCPNCKSSDIYNRGKQGRTLRYSCNSCKTNFSDFTGTIFEKSRLPFGTILWILTNIHNKSVLQMSKELKISRKAISRIVKLIRKSLLENNEDPLLEGEIEIDEMYLVAGDKGVKKNTPEQED
jgi:transposase-like protein